MCIASHAHTCDTCTRLSRKSGGAVQGGMHAAALLTVYARARSRHASVRRLRACPPSPVVLGKAGVWNLRGVHVGWTLRPGLGPGGTRTDVQPWPRTHGVWIFPASAHPPTWGSSEIHSRVCLHYCVQDRGGGGAESRKLLPPSGGGSSSGRSGGTEVGWGCICPPPSYAITPRLLPFLDRALKGFHAWMCPL